MSRQSMKQESELRQISDAENESQYEDRTGWLRLVGSV